ncbi:MAG: DinB family protein, partial [Bacteroidota bacterium]
NRKTHEADHNYLSTEDLIANFAAQRSKLVRLCHDHFEAMLTCSAIHPRLGVPMRMIDLLYFVAEHDDHHIATIHYLINR